MGTAYSVALVGFSQTESATFESFFRLASRRPPAYRVQDEVLDAQLLIVNADNRQALRLVHDAELPGRVLLIGAADGGTGWPVQHKPVKLVALLVALDAIVGLKNPPRPGAALSSTSHPKEFFRASHLQGLNASMRMAASGSPPDHPPSLLPGAGADRSFALTVPNGAGPARRGADTEFPRTRPMQRNQAVPAPSPEKAIAPPPGVMGLTDFGGLEELPSTSPSPSPAGRATRAPRSRLPTGPSSPAPEAARGDMLLVAESLVEGRILLKRFKRYGLAVDWSREAPQAVAMLQSHAYRLVVIDRLGGQPDGYHVCRTAKQTRGPKGAPVVIMFAPTAGSMDRMRAGLAGSDAYLSRSVDEAELYKVLAQHRLVHLNGFAPTNVGF